jgi:transposase
VEVTRIGMDIAKQRFDLHGVDRAGEVTLRRTLTRERVREFFAQLPRCEIGMEACGGAHYWHRELSKLGHTVRLLSAHKVKPYVEGNKNNRHDAAAICEAMGRRSMRFVEPKSTVQQDLQSLHRVRALLMRDLTALSNQLRGILHEYGIVMARGAAALKSGRLHTESNLVFRMSRSCSGECHLPRTSAMAGVGDL